MESLAWLVFSLTVLLLVVIALAAVMLFHQNARAEQLETDVTELKQRVDRIELATRHLELLPAIKQALDLLTQEKQLDKL